MKVHPAVVPVLLLAVGCAGASAQQTVFNVPSGDVLDRGQVYGELDLTCSPSGVSGSLTPRIVVGIGHRIEVGLNLNGIGAPGNVQTTPTPTIKWKVNDGGRNGWGVLFGDNVFLPAQNRSYNAGNYVYAELTKTWKTGTRATFGAYDFTGNTVAAGNRAGGQFALEQPLGRRLTLAADWFTGHHALGYVTPGIIVKVTPKFTWYGSYQIGNSGVRDGNHQFLMELGWSFR